MQRKDTRRHWPWWSLCGILLMAGCNSLPLSEHGDSTPTPDGDMRGERPHSVRKRDFVTPISFEGTVPGAVPGKPVPISLDTVLRLAQDQNNQVRLARMRVQESFADHEMADKQWLPDLSFGMGTWRHDGGIQDFQGNLVNSHYGSAFGGLDLRGKYDWKETLYRRVEAERRYWQQKGDLSKLSNENLLDATCTYVDLMAARTGVAISLDTEKRLNELLDQALALAKIDPGLRVEVIRIKTELSAQNVLTVKLREASKGASSKLAYLLGLDPTTELEIVEPKLVPIKLVDASQPVQTFVNQVMDQGPGVRELEGLLRTVEAARNTNYGWSHWLPSIELNMLEGGYAAGPGSQLDWANRFDLGVNLRWNLNEFLYAKHKRQQANMQIQQVQLSYHDLRMKLTLGVQEARDAILGGTEQVRLADTHIKHADESYQLSEQRLKQNIKGRSTSEVLLALRGLGGSRLEYLQAVRDLNKAQMRLYALVGTTDAASKLPVVTAP